ncbi:MAG: transporter, partial [Bacteroidales bacterium]|nr:transporter [Bacteroidales bacterium]
MMNLFTQGGTVSAILILALVVASGLYLGRIKVKGISLGTTWILFVGILLSHFGLRIDPTMLSFIKDFGLILFVFAIGLQVGPGFFSAFKREGLPMNML